MVIISGGFLGFMGHSKAVAMSIAYSEAFRPPIPIQIVH